jgi:E3 ubiquitin-protein ligase NEDD4
MGGGETFPHAAARASAAALPPGWESSTTPDGRPYFIDHNTHTTTFQDPHLPTDPNMPKDWVAVTLEGEPLPAGWEARRKINADGEEGRLYFLDHNKKKTSWDDPRHRLLEDREGEKGELPASWEERWKEDGKKYYVDHNTKMTSWDDPRGDGKTPAAAA